MPTRAKAVACLLITLVIGAVFLARRPSAPGALERAEIETVVSIVDCLSDGESERISTLVRALPEHSPIKGMASYLLTRPNKSVGQNREEMRQLMISYLVVWVVNETAHSRPGPFPSEDTPAWLVRLMLRMSDSWDRWDLSHLDEATASSMCAVFHDFRDFANTHDESHSRCSPPTSH